MFFYKGPQIYSEVQKWEMQVLWKLNLHTSQGKKEQTNDEQHKDISIRLFVRHDCVRIYLYVNRLNVFTRNLVFMQQSWFEMENKNK